jgi:hypothetical protein
MANKPRNTVFSTPEVIEEILSYLPPPELLVIQRVSWEWKNAIMSSPKLQRKLFFSPIPDSFSGRAVLNPLLAAIFPPLFEIGTPEPQF